MDCNRVVGGLKSVSEGLHQALMGIAVGRELVFLLVYLFVEQTVLVKALLCAPSHPWGLSELEYMYGREPEPVVVYSMPGSHRCAKVGLVGALCIHLSTITVCLY